METFNKIRAVPYCSCIYKLSKLSGEYHRDISEQEYQKCLNDCVKNDVLSTAFCYARYTMGKEELTEFGMKNSLTLPSLANKHFNSLRDENDEPSYTYTDPFLRNFVREAIKGGRCNAFNQHYKSENSDEVFNIISKELNVTYVIF